GVVAAVLVARAALLGGDSAPAPATPQPAAAPKIANSRITHVTVYQSNALVTREVDVPEGAGTLELVVSPLPAQTVNSSLYSEGTDGVRVLTTRYRMRQLQEDTREEVRKKEAELKKLQLDAQRIQAEIEATKENMQLVGKMEGFTAAEGKGTLTSES